MSEQKNLQVVEHVLSGIEINTNTVNRQRKMTELQTEQLKNCILKDVDFAKLFRDYIPCDNHQVFVNNVVKIVVEDLKAYKASRKYLDMSHVVLDNNLIIDLDSLYNTVLQDLKDNGIVKIGDIISELKDKIHLDKTIFFVNSDGHTIAIIKALDTIYMFNYGTMKSDMSELDYNRNHVISDFSSYICSELDIKTLTTQDIKTIEDKLTKF